MPPKRGTEAYDKWRNSEKYKLFIDGRTGENNPFYNHHHTDEFKQNQREMKKGKWAGENNPNYGGKNIPWNKDKKGLQVSWNKNKKNPALSERNRQQVGEKHPFYNKKRPHHAKLMKERMIGKGNHQWIDGRSYELYPLEFKKIRASGIIRKRDNYICQKCSRTETKEGKNLAIHHIDYNKKNCKFDNLITLCQGCNNKANKNRKKWVFYYQKKIQLCFAI